MLKTPDNITVAGHFQILSVANGKVVWESPVMKNRILNTGLGLIVQHHAGSGATPLEISTLEIGSGDNAVTAGDTALETVVLAGILPARITPSALSIEIEFFIVDAELTNGTYREIMLKCGTVPFTRALFTTPYVKASGRDTIIRYTLSYAAG